MRDSDAIVSDLMSKFRGGAEARTAGRPAAEPEVLAKATTQGDAAKLPVDEVPDTGKYEAYKPVDRDVFCMSVYTQGAANVHAAFQYFQFVADDKRGKTFDIVFGFFVVRVKGRSLLPVILAIKSKKCVFINQYERRAGWPEPQAGEPVIEKIEIIFQPSARVEMLEKS